jgi:hypothetical protein
MNVYLNCIPCFSRQALEASCLASADPSIRERSIRAVLRELSNVSWNTSPAHIGRKIHQLIKKVTGNLDPYASVKKKFNELALKFYPNLEEEVKMVSDPLATAIKIALAGNIIDSGARPAAQIDIEAEIKGVFKTSLDKNSLEKFKKVLTKAQNILFLGDNAGEIVFDKLLIQQIGPKKITYVVKGKPIINDATLEDAETVGLTKLVKVIDNGTDFPGTVLSACSQAFIKIYNKADLVIAKGQGNYETLTEVNKPIIFLLKVKCPTIAQTIKKKVGEAAIYLHCIDFKT